MSANTAGLLALVVLRAVVVYDRNAYPEGPNGDLVVPLREHLMRLPGTVEPPLVSATA
jgi:hypothetical protein